MSLRRNAAWKFVGMGLLPLLGAIRQGMIAALLRAKAMPGRPSRTAAKGGVLNIPVDTQIKTRPVENAQRRLPG